MGARAAPCMGSQAWREGLLVRSLQDMFKDALANIEGDKFDDAIPNLNTIIELHPLVVASFVQRGRVHWEMKRWDKAKEDFSRALQLDPNSADAKWTMGLIELQTGNFERGWELYDQRWDSSVFNSPKLKTRLPEWRPHRAYQSVLVWCEQGIGDQLIYSSLLSLVKNCTKKVTVMIDVRLIGMLQRANPHITFIPHDSKVKNSDYDSQIAIGSIGRHFIKRSEDIEILGATRYIYANPERAEQVKQELGLTGEEFVIGLSWASTAPRIDKHKSVALEELIGLWDIPNVKVINLQYGKPEYDIEPFEEKTGKQVWQTTVSNFFDLEGVAATMLLCDAVVSVSNANVHIAGAMGRPTYVLDANKLWYWNHKNGRSSLFYPSVKLFPREGMTAPWTNQIQELIQEIRDDFKR
jgi:tetratricopeptide (TPR) repeat protein